MSHTQQHWDIFCRVIDNYGDIGVCWRLARQLAGEYQQTTRLWLDNLTALQRLWPQAEVYDGAQIAGVEVRHWHGDAPSDAVAADIVIEAFACDIPARYIAAMAARKAAGHPPLWINLEYLSGESWVEGCHRLTSTHPASGLGKVFFFPGFSPATGGLLREQALLAERERFCPAPWLAAQGIHPQHNALLVSLFAYENPQLRELLTEWQHSLRPIHCLVPEGKVLSSLREALGRPDFSQAEPQAEPLQLGALRLQVIPFLNQLDYDRLLWSCDINFVRGEDSFVRAQWAGKPFVWHIYPQEDNAHHDKLDAFLQRYCQALPPPLHSALPNLWQAWNDHQPATAAHSSMAQLWQQCLAQYPAWQAHSQQWCQQLSQQPSLCEQLLALAKNTTESIKTTV